MNLNFGFNREMLTYVIEQLQLRKGDWPAVAFAAGVKYHTLKNLADGTVRNPRLKTVETIYEWLKENEGSCSRCGQALRAE